MISEICPNLEGMDLFNIYSEIENTGRIVFAKKVCLGIAYIKNCLDRVYLNIYRLSKSNSFYYISLCIKNVSKFFSVSPVFPVSEKELKAAPATGWQTYYKYLYGKYLKSHRSAESEPEIKLVEEVLKQLDPQTHVVKVL